MTKMILYFVLISVINSTTYGSLILMGDSGKTLIGRIHPGKTRSKQSPSLEEQIRLGLAETNTLNEWIKPEGNETSSNRERDTSSEGLEMYTISTKIDIQSPANKTENKSSIKTSNKQNETDLQTKEITVPTTDDSVATQRLRMYKRFGEEFKYFFLNNIRRWLYRRHGYFDSLASSII